MIALARPALAQSTPPLQTEYLDIYLKMTEATKMENSGDNRNALASFEDCYNRLRRIHVKNPNWENALVLSRMTDCRASILTLETKLAPPAGKPIAAAAPVSTAPAPESTQARLVAAQVAVKTSPNDSAAWLNLGTIYFQLGQTDPAIDALQRGLAIDSTNIYGHNYLGCAFLRKDKITSAVKEFQKAISLVDTFAEPHYNLAILYATEDPPAWKQARTEYKRALELGVVPDPHFQKVMRNAAR